jgi:hypothetical protein
MSLRSKWAAGKARGGRISKAIRNRRATQPPAHFQCNPPGRGQLAVFPRCSLLTYQSRYVRRSRLEKQPTDLRRHHHYMRDGTLDPWGRVNVKRGSTQNQVPRPSSFQSSNIHKHCRRYSATPCPPCPPCEPFLPSLFIR